MFFLIIICGLLIMQYTPLVWYVSSLPKGAAVPLWLKILPALTTVFFFSLMSLNRVVRTDFTEILATAAYCFLGFLFILFSFSVLFIFAQATAKVFHIPIAPLSFVKTAFASAVLCSLFAVYNAHKTPQIKNITVAQKSAAEGIKIIQLSDMHLGESVSVKQLESLTAEINKIKPDIILFTGDIFETYGHKTPKFTQLLKDLNPPLGKYGVLGNHEYYRGKQRSENLFAAAGIEVLNNTSKTAGPLNIIGVEDIRTAPVSEEQFLKTVSEGKKEGKVNIVLSHTPYYFDGADALGIDLMLCGHTHRGQIWPFEYLNHLLFKDVYGLRKGKSGGVLYVTSGTFYWGPPMRFLTNNEAPLITLSK